MACKQFGPECKLSRVTLKAEALCHVRYAVGVGVVDYYDMFTPQDSTCSRWELRLGEPLGLGITKWWFLPVDHKFTPAAIIHDLRYDVLTPGESTAVCDREFYENCLLLSTNAFDRAEAMLFYGIIRIYGTVGLFRKR